MIKKIIKSLSILILIIILAALYLSVFGIQTKKFNNEITKSVSKINKKISLSLNDVKYKLNPYNFTINIITINPQILLGNSKLEIKEIKTNIALRSLINDKFLIDDLQIITKKIKLNDAIKLARSFKNYPQFFILDAMTKGGFINANIIIKFDEYGKIKENYRIKGFVKKAKLNILNKIKLNNFNFEFDIDSNNFLLKEINTELNNIKIKSPLIKIKKNKDLYFVNGEILNDNWEFDIQEFKTIFINLFNNINIKKIEFSSASNFSFNLDKKLKLNDLQVETIVNLKHFILNGKHLNLKSYFPNFVEEIKFENNKININYNKNIFDIKGNGNILLEDKSDNLFYQIIKNNNNLIFDSQINIKNNPFILDFINYEKKEGSSSLVSIKGNLQKNNDIRFDLISLNENDNKILIKGLDLNRNFKIIDIQAVNANYKNNKNILNKINLKKKKKIFFISGESFDASKIVDKIMDSNEKSSSIFHNLNSKINIQINKTYIDEINYMNDLSGNLKFHNNKINNLKLESSFPNNKIINLSIKSNKNMETITKLFTSYPKPLIKRYNFIKGFEDGNLDFHSTKRGNVSNSVLIIDNFKVKEVPMFAKLLSLASLQGIADTLTGEGIRFTDFEMSFSNRKGILTIEEMYAIGPAVSILMDGYLENKQLISLRGTLVPATTINRSIASIPLLGKILIGEKTGEGVFGVSFKIKGPPKNLKTTVNPIKTLTPRFITRTLEKIKKN